MRGLQRKETALFLLYELHEHTIGLAQFRARMRDAGYSANDIEDYLDGDGWSRDEEEDHGGKRPR